MITLTPLRALWLMLALLASCANAKELLSNSIAGHVAFVHGDVQLVNGSKSPRRVQTGEPVYVGDFIQTLANAHLHLRMVDNAFVALRPDSQLVIRTYEYDNDQPQSSRIRIDLQYGTSRAVTGKGGQAAKQHYRFNTPLAAIGLRGTDYTVSADEGKTRVSVTQGGVIVSPFSSECLSAQLGPCRTPLSRELTADKPNTFIEVTPNQAPRLLTAATSAGTSDTKAQRPRSMTDEPISNGATSQALDRAVANQPVVGHTSDRPDTLARWGRWSALAQQMPAGSETINKVFPQLANYQIVTSNQAFAMAYPGQASVNLPDMGRVQFELVAAESYVKDNAVNRMGVVKGGQLEMDFAQKTFKTQVSVFIPVMGLETIKAQGSVDAYGRLQSNPLQSDSKLQGIVLNKGLEATYLFEKNLFSGALLSGAAQWVR